MFNRVSFFVLFVIVALTTLAWCVVPVSEPELPLSKEFLQELKNSNQFYPIKHNTEDPNVVIVIGGGYPFNSDPMAYSDVPYGGLEYQFAVVYLRDSRFNQLDEVNLRKVVKAGDVVEAWYSKSLGTEAPISPVGGVKAYYWNPETGLAVAVYSFSR